MIPTMNASKTIDVNQTNKDDPPFKEHQVLMDTNAQYMIGG